MHHFKSVNLSNLVNKTKVQFNKTDIKMKIWIFLYLLKRLNVILNISI